MTTTPTLKAGVGMAPKAGAVACWENPNGTGAMDLTVQPWGPTGNDEQYFYENPQLFPERYGGKPQAANFCGDDAEDFWKNAAKLQDCFQKGSVPAGWQRLGPAADYDGNPTQQEQYDAAATLPRSQGTPVCPG